MGSMAEASRSSSRTALPTCRSTTVVASRAAGLETRSLSRASLTIRSPPDLSRRAALSRMAVCLAGLQQAHGLVHVAREVGLVPVDKHKIVRGVCQPGQDVPRPAGNGAGPVRGAPGFLEGLACGLEMLDIHVDGGQHRLRTQSTKQADAGDPRARANFDGGLGL